MSKLDKFKARMGKDASDAGAAKARNRDYSYESPYASGASSGSVIKHTRRPDMKRATEASGKAVREVQRPAPSVALQHSDDAYSIRPKHFSEACIIADRYLEGTSVLMDLTLTSINQRQRFIDFAAGLVYALDGNLTRSANHVYLLTPGTE